MAKLRYILVQIAFACLIGSLGGCAKRSVDLSYVPTGDVLYDRFAVLVLDQIDEVWSEEAREDVDSLYNFNYSDVVSWRFEFKDDARYWQLRAFVDSQESREQWLGVLFTDLPPYLDAQLVKKIKTGLNPPGCYAALPWTGLSEAEPGLGLELVNQAILTDADNSYFYYIKATFLVQAGDHKGAINAVHDGNRAPKHYLVFPFPYNMVLENPEQVKGGGNQAVAEILASSYSTQTMTDWIFQKKLFKKLLKRTDLKPSDIDELIIAAQRLGTRNPNLSIEPLQSCVLIGSIERAIPKQSFYLNPGQISELEKLFALNKSIVQEISDRFTPEDFDALVKSLEELESNSSGTQLVYHYWQDRMESNEFLQSLHPRFDPFANPPLGSWFPANQTASPGTPSR